MLGTIELQVKTATFLATQIAKYRSRPWCPPSAQYGVQLQRVRFGTALIRQTVPDEFTVFGRDYYGDISPLPTTAKGFLTQLDLELELDLTTEDAIAAHPNTMPPDLLVLRPHVIFNLYVIPSDTDGCVLVMNRSGVEWPPGSVPTLPVPVPLPPGTTPTSILEPLILSMLPSISVPVNLSTGTMGVSNIINAGLAADSSGNRLVLRAESFTLNDNPIRWTNFHRGAIVDRLGSSDWSLFIKASDMVDLLNNSIWEGLRDQIDSSGNAHLISCATDYTRGNGTATFTTTAFIRVTPPVIPDFTKEVPIVTTFSHNAATGGIVVEIWLKGIEDLVSDATGLFSVAMLFVGPFLSIPLTVLFGEGRSYLEDEINGVSPGDIGDLEFTHVTPYLLRATMPIPSPTLLGSTAKVTQLVADPDGFNLQGTWPLVTLTDSKLTVKSDGFDWRGPDFSCGQSEHGIGQQIRDNPVQFTRLTASIVLGQTGQLPISLCSAILMNAPSDVGPEVKFGFVPSNVPTTVFLAAPGTWASTHPNLPIKVTLRTSTGVLDVVIPACGPLSQEIITALAGAAEIKVLNCERVVPAAFEHIRSGQKFSVAWINNPLVDPPRPEEITQRFGSFELWSVQAYGLTPGENLSLGTGASAQIRAAWANARGQVSLATMLPVGEVPVLSGTLSQEVGPAARRRLQASTVTSDDFRAQGLSVFRQSYVRGGTLPFRTAPRDLVPLPGLGRGRFAALVEGSVVCIAATNPQSPRQLDTKGADGARGLLPLPDGVLAYGVCGAIVLKGDGTSRDLGEHGMEVLGAAVVGNQIALLRRGGLETRPLRSGCVQKTYALEATTIVEYAGQLLVANRDGISSCRGVAVDALRRLPFHLPREVTSFKSAQGSVLAQLDDDGWVRLDFRAHTFEKIEGTPWELRFQISTGVAAKLSARRRSIDFYSVREPCGMTPESAATVTRAS
jgi:hypothetical protein